MTEHLLAPQLAGRLFITPPGQPPDRLAIVRKAFAETLADAEFLADAVKRNMEIQYTPDEEIAEVVERAYWTRPDIVERVRRINRAN